MLNDRGISLWPWTFSTGTSMAFYNEFLWGVDGLTTDDAQLTKNTVMDFNVDKIGANTLAPAGTMDIKAEVTTYGRVTAKAENVKVVWLTDSLGASYDPATGMFTAGTSEGQVAFMLSYSAKLPNGKEYVLYSQPITVDVVAEAVEETPDVFKIVCLSVIAVCSIATVVVLATGKKKKD